MPTLLNETRNPAAAVTVKVATWLAAAAAAWVLLTKLLPPQALPAPVPDVPTPAPRVSPLTVTWGSAVVTGNGEAPKLLTPPG